MSKVTLFRDNVLRWLIERLSRWTVRLYKMQRVPVWRSADGRVKLLTSMSDQHLFNAVRATRSSRTSIRS